MNSLEFIEKEIKNAKELLKRLEKLKVISNKYELQLNEVLEKDTQEKLFYLQQIKSELEAWEVVKNKNVKIGTVRTSPNYEVFNSLFNSNTIEKNRITEIEFDIIQKALEVIE